MSDARADVLARIRAGLAGVVPAALPATRRRVPPDEPLAERFARRLVEVDGRLHHASDPAEAAAVVRRILSASGARSLVRSDAVELEPLVTGLDLEVHPRDAPREVLLAADAGLTTAQAGIAETGTLVLVSTDERHRLASLVPPVHVALLATSRLVADLGAALAGLTADRDRPAPTVTLVTGPSRTGDIELQLVIGVHGPRELHVVLLDDGPPARPQGQR